MQIDHLSRHATRCDGDGESQADGHKDDGVIEVEKQLFRSSLSLEWQASVLPDQLTANHVQNAIIPLGLGLSATLPSGNGRHHFKRAARRGCIAISSSPRPRPLESAGP